MTRLGHIFAVLLFAFALLMGAAGGAVAHADPGSGPADHHHGTRHVPSPAQHGGSHKAALTIVAPCCPAAEAPVPHDLSVPVATAAASWAPRPDYAPDARAVAPDTPPPKQSL